MSSDQGRWPDKMKVEIGVDSLVIHFPAGAQIDLPLHDVTSIDLQTVPTMTVDVDFVSLNHENGESLEISGETEGFGEACDFLSEKLRITPSISSRFPVLDGSVVRAYDQKG